MFGRWNLLLREKAYFQGRTVSFREGDMLSWKNTSNFGGCGFFPQCTLSRTTECPLKMDYFNREYIFQPLIFRGYINFLPWIPSKSHKSPTKPSKNPTNPSFQVKIREFSGPHSSPRPFHLLTIGRSTTWARDVPTCQCWRCCFFT